MSGLEARALRVAFPKQGDVRAIEVGTSGIVTDPDAIATASVLVSAGTAGTFLAAAWDGAAQVAVPARNVVLVFSSHADWDASTAVVIGTAWDGRTAREEFAIPNGGNATVAGVVLFKEIASIYFPAQTGAGGTATAGWGAIVSLEEFSGRYITMHADQIWSANADTSGATITQPDQSVTGHVANAARSMTWPASTPVTFLVTPQTAAMKADAAATAALRWYPSVAAG